MTGDSFGIDRDSLHHIEVNLIDIFTDDLNQIRVALELDISSRSNIIHFINDTCIMRCQYLCTIIPVCFVTIVFFRIVRSSQDNTALAAKVADSERHFRSRTHIIKQIYLNAISREDVGRSFCKQTTVVTAVMPYHHRNLRQIFEVLLQIVGKTLCSRTYCVDVHTVATYSHNTTQTTGSKFKILIECFDQFSFIFVLQHPFHFSLSFGIIRRGQPFFGFLSDLLNEFLIFHFDYCLLVNDYFLVLCQSLIICQVLSTQM